MKNRMSEIEEQSVTVLRPVWFRPFLDWHALKIVGMLLLALSQFLTLSKVLRLFMENVPQPGAATTQFLKAVSSLSLPLMMVAVFSCIIVDDRHIKRRLYFYFCLAFAFYILEIAGVHAYIYKTLAEFGIDLADAAILVEVLVRYLLAPFAGINVFLDFFLCTLFYYFLIYTPKNYRGIRLFFFRCGVLLPALYILAGVVLNGLMSLNIIHLDFYTVALLPSKSISVYVLFFFMVLYRRVHLSYTGDTFRETLPFRSDAFSVFLAILLTLISVADYFLSIIPNASAFGIGNASSFFLAVPLVLCFDCEKKPKHRFLVPVYDSAFYLVLYAVLFYYYSYLANVVIAILYGMAS